MSYTLCIRDPARHAPLPTSADDALGIWPRLKDVTDTRNLTLAEFGETLVQLVGADSHHKRMSGGAQAFRGCDRNATHRDLIRFEPVAHPIRAPFRAVYPPSTILKAFR